MTHPLVGHLAPDFSLPDQDGGTVTLSDLRGTPVLIVFTPFAFAPLSDDELHAIRDSAELKKSGGVRVLLISCDSVHTLKAWACQNYYQDTMLSDAWPHGEVARWYGIFNPRKGIATRASFLVDGTGVVRWAVIHAPDDPRSVKDYIEAIQAL